ncbi:MAG: ABC transporter-like protein [Chlorobi bacterium OLB5]|nr:MAG: ABC transporter-like protein [Chlorobi bacterium OLB5]
MTEEFAVEMKNITKTFGDIKANDLVNLTVKKGEIHAIVGENGAGKSTLMNILYGMYHPDNGKILINGKEAAINSPADAIKLGIGMVHQHFMLVSTLSVLENIILGDETVKNGMLNLNVSREKIKSILNSFNISIDLNASAGELSVGTQQKIEILKLLYRNAQILILDEPTAVLTPRETAELFKTMTELKNSGRTIILITHKLNEVLSVSDSVTVLRKGKVTGNLKTSETDIKVIARLIVGGELQEESQNNITPGNDTVLEINDLHVKNSRGNETVKGISLNISRGEILGIAGVEGNGQTELVEAVCGMLKPESGEIKINGKLPSHTVTAHIPANRHLHGMVKEYTLSENVLLGRESEEKFSGKFFLNYNSLKDFTNELIAEYDIRPGDSSAVIGGLSGGNQQKLVAAREITKDSPLLIVSHPTRGLDIRAAEFVHNALLNECKNGRAVFLVSSDINELLKLSTRIAVMFNGRLNAVLNSNETSENEIGEYMLGLHINKIDKA